MHATFCPTRSKILGEVIKDMESPRAELDKLATSHAAIFALHFPGIHRIKAVDQHFW